MSNSLTDLFADVKSKLENGEYRAFTVVAVDLNNKVFASHSIGPAMLSLLGAMDVEKQRILAEFSHQTTETLIEVAPAKAD
jgi:hypothetical protein